MAIRTFQAFSQEAITQNTAKEYFLDVSNYLGDYVITGQGMSAVAGAGVVVVTVQGSFDNANWNTGGAVTLLSGVASDGAWDYGTADMVSAYPYLKFIATENDTGAITAFTLIVSVNDTLGSSSGGTPAVHASSHENGGTDEIDVTGLSGELADNQPPKTHASSHQNGGADEINVAGLSGELADNQPPKAHTHTESEISDLDHDATKIQGTTVDATGIGDGKVLTYQSASGKIEYITPSPAGAAINSIQRGTITIGAGDTTDTATITSVDTTKSTLTLLGTRGTQNTIDNCLGRIILTNATTVTGYRANTGGTLTINFQVVEYSSGINSIQRGTATIADGQTIENVTISSVDTSKTVVVHNGVQGLAANINSSVCTLELTSATNLRAERVGTTNDRPMNYEVVEFS